MSERDEQFQTITTFQSSEELEAYLRLANLVRDSQIPATDLPGNLALYLDRSALAHILYIDQLYRRILSVHGVIAEFGVRWGRNLALFTSLRNLYEPRNASRRVIGFDTFEGFPSVSKENGQAPGVGAGAYSVGLGHELTLETLLATHEKFGFRSHVRKFELVKGDVAETLPKYLTDNPEVILSLVYFDLDLFEPTKKCLELIRGRLVKGSVIAFDELTLHEFPGETVALLQTWGLGNLRLRRTAMCQYESFAVID